MASMVSTGVLEKAANIRLLALDVDGVLTDGRLYFTEQGQELKAFHSKDGLGLKALMRYGIKVALITARTSPLLSHRAEQLGIEKVYQGCEDKLQAYEDLKRSLDLEDGAVAYVGDDWIDLPVLRRVGLSISVADGMPEVRQRVHHVTERAGGNGAVREVCQLLLEAQGFAARWLNELMER